MFFIMRKQQISHWYKSGDVPDSKLVEAYFEDILEFLKNVLVGNWLSLPNDGDQSSFDQLFIMLKLIHGDWRQVLVVWKTQYTLN